MMLPDGIRGRIVAAGLLLVIVIAFAGFVIQPGFTAYEAFTGEIDSMQQDIVRYERIISELPSLQAANNRLEQSRPLAPFLLKGNNPALAAASLQRLLQEVTVQHGTRVVSVRVQPVTPDGPLQKVSVVARLQTSTKGLRDTLHSLETGSPYVFVDTLNVNTRTRRRSRTPAAELDVQLTLSGLVAPPGHRLNGVADG